MKALAIVALLAACDAKPTTAKDPWATPTTTEKPASDPWGASPSSPPPAPSAPVPTTAALPGGTWKCLLVGTTWMNGQRYTMTTQLNGFSLDGNAFTSPQEGNGTVAVEGDFATFHGGGFDGWRGAFNHHKDGSFYLVFGGASHRDAQPDHGSSGGDIECEPVP